MPPVFGKGNSRFILIIYGKIYIIFVMCNFI